MRFIGKKISIQNNKETLSIIIAASVERWKETLLMGWLAAWIFCGGYFIFELFGPNDKDLKLYLGVLLVFWAFYLLRIGKAFFWRKYGYESLRFEGDALKLKLYGKVFGFTKEYFVENISTFKKVEMAKFNPLSTVEDSFWVVGGDKLEFEYNGKIIRFAKQIDAESTTQLMTALNAELIQRKRKLKKG